MNRQLRCTWAQQVKRPVSTRGQRPRSEGMYSPSQYLPISTLRAAHADALAPRGLCFRCRAMRPLRARAQIPPAPSCRDGRLHFTLHEYDIVASGDDATLSARALTAIGLRRPVVPMVIVGREVPLESLAPSRGAAKCCQVSGCEQRNWRRGWDSNPEIQSVRGRPGTSINPLILLIHLPQYCIRLINTSSRCPPPSTPQCGAKCGARLQGVCSNSGLGV
jgi:hypothetical protein